MSTKKFIKNEKFYVKKIHYYKTFDQKKFIKNEKNGKKSSFLMKKSFIIMKKSSLKMKKSSLKMNFVFLQVFEIIEKKCYF